MTAITFSGAADWFAGTHAGTHHEVWAGNTSRDTLTMGYAPKMPVAAGIRTWFGGPDAAFYNGCAYIPYASYSGSNTILGVAKHVYATGAWSYNDIKTVAAVEDHLKFNVHVCSDGKILLFLARQDYDDNIHWWKSTNAEDISAFSAEITLTLTGQKPNYPTIARLSSDSNRIYVLFRDAMYGAEQGDGGIWYISSSDEFAGTGNVTGPTKLVDTPAGAVGGNSGLYFHGSTNGTDRIDVAMSHFYDNSTDPKKVHDVVHFYCTASAGTLTVKASDGTTLGTPTVGTSNEDIAYAAFTAANKSLIYDTDVDAGSYRMWVADVQTYSGSPAVTACRYTDGDTNSDYDYLRWDFAAGAWSSAKVVWDASTHGANGPVGSGSGYNNYYGGCRMDPSDSGLIWLCVGTQAATSRLKKLTSTDLFASNRSDVAHGYAQAVRHNIRPAIPFNLAGEHVGKMDVIWCAGVYTSPISYLTVLAHPNWDGAVVAFDLTESSGTPSCKLHGYWGTPSLTAAPTQNVTAVGNGKGITLNGSSQYVVTGINTYGTTISSVLEFWWKPSALNVTQIVGAFSTGGSARCWGGPHSSTPALLFGLGSVSEGAAAGDHGLSTSDWNLATLTIASSTTMSWQTNGVTKRTTAALATKVDVSARLLLGARGIDGPGADNYWTGTIAQAIQYWNDGRGATAALARYNSAAAGTFTSANKTAVVTNGPVVGPTVTPAATLPTGASYTLKLISTSTPAGQTKTGTASTPIVFDGVEIADGDEVSIVVAAASSDKTVAPSVTSFSIAA
jgi:hypothetical protein